MTDITELALITKIKKQLENFDTVVLKEGEAVALVEALEKAQDTITEMDNRIRKQNRHVCELFDDNTALRQRIAELEEAERKLCAANVTLDARAEQAERERENWRTSFDNERFRADKLKAHIDDIEPIRAAAEKLVRCKGRYHSELNYRALAALFGVNTPDLPPLEHENVHYADAAEMEIAALRQRIAELESRTVKLPKPHAHLIWIQAGHAPDDYWDDVAVSHSEKDLCCDGSERYPVYARWEIEEMLAAAGIKVEAE
ncbi:ead/Ea22-like family protein [Klebsiella quasipneumoniae]|uniref:Ead domain protein n=1 Tax=Klebsiella quasipneumoniae TaxID=1463165 RepID=A0ABD7N1R9_9ENTR|nr:Ead domain protein [Klebsiella quasipneumoniae]